MAPHINDLPNAVLCKVLDNLDTNDKFLVRLVCKSWKIQIDKNVHFHVVINDGNYDLISRRFGFGTSRCVTSICIADYSIQHVPITNLTTLKTLSVKMNVHKLAVTQLLSKATNLHSLRLYVHHLRDSKTAIAADWKAKGYPALYSIKDLYIGYDVGNSYSTFWRTTAWNEILYEEMPNVERLVVDLYLSIPPVRGFDFFRLASRMPKLHEFTYHIWTRCSKQYYKIPRDSQALTPIFHKRLANLNLIRVTAIMVQIDEPIWKIILAKQHQLQELNLCSDYNSKEGFSISLIRPVLYNNKESLRSISLQIDINKSGEIDMEMFASLPSLQKLCLYAWPIPYLGQYTSLSDIRNCSSVVSNTLQKLSVRGFKFSEDDIIKLIKSISNEDLDTVRISHRYAYLWKIFETRMEEMGIVRNGCDSAHDSSDVSRLVKEPKVYVGKTVNEYYKNDFSGVLERDYNRRVKDVTVESQSLELVSRYMYLYE